MEEVITCSGGEIDTAVPFKSVKAAVSMFGEIADTKALEMLNSEKQASKNSNLHQAQKDLVKLKEQLFQAEASKQQALTKLQETKNLLVITEEKLELLSSEPSLTTGGTDAKSETSNLLEENLQEFKQKHEGALANVEAAKLEIVRLKSQLQIASHPACEDATLINEIAATTLEVAKKAQNLLSELLTSHSSNKEATADSRNFSEISIGTEQFDNPLSLAEEIEVLGEKVSSAKQLEAELSASSAALVDLKAELAAPAEPEARLTLMGTEVSENLINMATDLELSRIAEANAIEVSEATCKELEETKLKLKKLADENASLPLVVESLKAEVEKAKGELLALKKKESKPTAATSLNADLEKGKAELSIALSAEAKAKEAITSLTTALQQVTMEANEARVAAAIALEEAQKATLETEQARAAISILEAKLEAAVQETEAAKEAEALAMAKLESFKESIEMTPTGNSEPTETLPISKEEYEVLNKKLQDTEDLANKRIAAAQAQIDAVKASEKELQVKLEAARQETEANNMAVKDALQRAEKAAAAKTAVEGELRKRRTESEQRRKIAEEVARSSPIYSGVLLDGMLEDKNVQMESLSQVLQIKIPPIDEKTIHMEQVRPPKKVHKRSISKRFTSFVLRKRN